MSANDGLDAAATAGAATISKTKPALSRAKCSKSDVLGTALALSGQAAADCAALLTLLCLRVVVSCRLGGIRRSRGRARGSRCSALTGHHPEDQNAEQNDCGDDDDVARIPVQCCLRDCWRTPNLNPAVRISPLCNS